MEKPLILIDKDGNKIEDLDKFLSEQKFYLTDNEGNKIDDLEKFFADNPELKDKFNSLELYGNPFEFLKFRLLNGDIKTIIEHFYYSKIKEIESRQSKDNFKEYLIKQKEFLDFLKDEFEARIELNSGIESEIKFAFSRAKQLKKIIEKHLKHLVTKKNESPKILAFNDNVEGGLDDIEIILKDINDLLFDGSTSSQWEQLLRGKKLDNPIVISNGVTIKDVKYFIKSLRNKTLKGRIYEDLGRLNVFIFEGKILTGKQMQKVDESTDAKLKNQIDNIISELK